MQGTGPRPTPLPDVQ